MSILKGLSTSPSTMIAQGDTLSFEASGWIALSKPNS